MAEYQCLLVEPGEGFQVIRLNRPEALNALNSQLLAWLSGSVLPANWYSTSCRMSSASSGLATLFLIKPSKRLLILFIIWVIFLLCSALIAVDIVSTSSMYIYQTDNVALYFKVVKLFCKFTVLLKKLVGFIDGWSNHR